MALLSSQGTGKRPCGARSCPSYSAVHAIATVYARLASASSKHCRLCAASAVQRWDRNICPCGAGSCLSSSAVHVNATVCARLASASSKHRRLCVASAVQRWDRIICPCDAGVCRRQSNGACGIGTFSCMRCWKLPQQLCGACQRNSLCSPSLG